MSQLDSWGVYLPPGRGEKMKKSRKNGRRQIAWTFKMEQIGCHKTSVT